MSLFLSTYINKLDKKGRISVPAQFRASLSSESYQGLILFRSYKHQAIEGCTMSRMERMSQSLDSMDLFSDTQDDMASAIFADAHQLPIDSDGRIVLPQELAAHAGFDTHVAFVGRGATFQLWHPDVFARMQSEIRGRMKIEKPTLKLSDAARD